MKSEAEILLWLRLKLTGLLEIEEIDADKRFKDYGLDSIKASVLISQLSSWLNLNLEPTLVWDYPTVNELINFLIHPEIEVKATISNYRTPKNINEPIAVIGIGCRFPNAINKNAYWELLSKGLSGISKIPEDRWQINEFYDPNLSSPGKMNTQWGGFLEHVDKFDADFFGISPREATQMDPQQRLMLELSWEALEDAGINPLYLKGSKTGVFSGAIWSDYLLLNSKAGYNNISQHTATGTHHSIIANRVSYFLGLEGPSMNIDTACSSSLVTIHLAIQSLWRGESDLALVGGVNLMITPDSTIAMSKFGALSPDGKSKAFDSAANGFVRGEGGGVVVLKPLSRALLDGDNIYSLILESSVNNDGVSNGLSAPNVKAQERLLIDVYKRAGIDPNSVHFVETHGTGTVLGDPIEAKALGHILSSDRSENSKLILGSVKTNIGHLEGAAGIAGFIKTALSIKHRKIPKNLHFKTPNPHIDFDLLKLQVPQALTEWPSTEVPALAGVNAFGFGGTNCHVILQEYRSESYELLALSAVSKKDLEAQAESVLSFIDSGIPTSLSSLCYSISKLVVSNKYKTTFIARSIQDLRKQLEDFLYKKGQGVSTLSFESVDPVAFVFSGYGSQWIGMGKDMLNTEPVFREKLKECDEIFQTFANWSIIDEICADKYNSRLDEVTVTEPVIFAIQVSLAALCESWGIRPSQIVGHSLGEIAACCVAGIIKLRDALKITYVRSSLYVKLPTGSLMALIGLPGSKLEKLIRGKKSISIAAYNGPASTVITGDGEEVSSFLDSLTRDNVYSRIVNIKFAGHSRVVDILQEDMDEALRGIQPQPENIPIHSTVYAKSIPYTQFNHQYWFNNLRQPVKFLQSITALSKNENYVFLELSPHPILMHSVGEFNDKNRSLSSLVRNENGRKSMLSLLARLFLYNQKVNWDNVFLKASLLELPIRLQHILRTSVSNDGVSEDLKLIPFSAHTKESLHRLIAESVKVLKYPAFSINNLTYTLSLKRAHLKHRLAIVSGSIEDVHSQLQQHIDGPTGTDDTVRTRKGKLVFVFSGQGGQWRGMVRDLLQTEIIFRNVIKECDRILQNELGATWSISQMITDDHLDYQNGDTEFVQPIICSIQIALSELWKSWGIIPDSVVGHSMGEIAAAYIAGIINLPEAMKLIYFRAKIMQLSKGQGKMLLIHHSATFIDNLLSKNDIKHVYVATSNSESNTLISGRNGFIDKAQMMLDENGIRWKEFSKDYSFHCPALSSYRAKFLLKIGDIVPRKSMIPFYSTVNGELMQGESIDSTYWGQNMVQPVKFSSAVKELLNHNYDFFLEIGPQNTLSAPIKDILIETQSLSAHTLTSLNKNKGSYESLYKSLSFLYTAGFNIIWSNLKGNKGHLIELPHVQFERKRFWINESLPSLSTKKPQISAGIFDLSIFYQVSWVNKTCEKNSKKNSGSWLLLCYEPGIADDLIRLFEVNHEPYIKVFYDNERLKYSSNSYFINPSIPSDYNWLFNDITKGNTIRGIIDFSSLRAHYKSTEVCIPLIDKAQEFIYFSLRYVLKAVFNNKIQAGLYLVTRGTQLLSTEKNIQVQHSALWGIGRTFALEYPTLKFKNIDLPSEDSTDYSNFLYNDLNSPETESNIVYRNGKRFVARLKLHDSIDESLAHCDPQKVYLITGGLGGLGLKIAQLLLNKGARKIVLIARKTQIQDEYFYKKLINSGALIEIRKADVAVFEEIKAIFDEFGDTLAGVIHAAGSVASEEFSQQTWSNYRSILLPKVHGTWNLHLLTKDLHLDFFLAVSSISTLIGSKNLSSYSVANSFIDSMSMYRKSIDLPFLGINLGPVEDVGMVTKYKKTFDAEVLEKVGYNLLNSDTVMNAIGRVLFNKKLHQVVIADINIERFTQHMSQVTSLFGIPGSTHKNLYSYPISEIPYTPAKSKDIIINQLQQSCKEVLGVHSQPLDKSVFDSGMNSLMAIEFVQSIQNSLNLRLQSSFLYSYPTIREMSDVLLEMIKEQNFIVENA